MSQHISFTEFLISCMVMLAIILIAGTWALSAWVEHYA